MSKQSTFVRYAWLLLAAFLVTFVASGVRAADPASSAAATPQGLFLHANVTVGKDFIGAVYDPVEQRLMQKVNQYGALVPFANAMKNGGAEGLIPRDVTSDEAAEAAINAALDTSLTNLKSAQSWDELVDHIVTDAKFESDIQELLKIGEEGVAGPRRVDLGLFYDRAYTRQRVMGTISRVLARDLLPGRPLINRWWHMARTGDCPRGPIRRGICNRLHNKIWGRINAEVDGAIAKIESQLSAKIAERLANPKQKLVTFKFTGVGAVTNGASGLDLYHWDHDGKKWDPITKVKLGDMPSEIVRKTVQTVLDKHPATQAPSCETRRAPPH